MTGGTGFVGRHVLEKLKQNSGFDVVYTYLNPHIEKKGDNSYQMDFGSNEMAKLIEKIRPEVLIHCAWQGLPKRERDICAINKSKSLILIRNFLKYGGQKIIALGSCLEYLEKEGAIYESAKKNLSDSFAKTKIELLEAISQSKAEYSWIRPFYLFGLGQHQNSILMSAIRNLDNRTFNWLEKPYISNDYVYVENLAELIFEMVSNEIYVKEINCGRGELVSNIEFVNVIRKTLNYPEYKFDKKLQLRGLYSDNTLLRTHFSSFQYPSLAESIKKIMQFR